MKLKKLLFPLLLVVSLLALLFRAFARRVAADSAAGSSPYPEIDAYLIEQMRRLNIPGAMLAIVDGERIVHARGFGRARPGGEAPTVKTPFLIGSLTKSFTALAVMQQVEAGKVELDAPVQRYLPWFRVADPQASARMTVRHLLHQTSGLPMMAGNELLANFDSRPEAAECQARALSTLKLSRPPGAACEYSNLNYNLLGLIVEAASGESYADYIHNHIFKPLDMRHSYTSRAVAQANGLAVGYRYWFGRPVPAPDLPLPQGSTASGQLISCAEDLAFYLNAYLNAGRLEEDQLLSEQGIETLLRGQVKFDMFGRATGRYGMGWFDIDLGSTKTYSHGGNVPEFSAFMALLPQQKQGLVLLVNADHYGLPPILAEVGMGAAALLAGQQPPPIELGFLPGLLRLLPLIPLLQVVGGLTTLATLRRWRQQPAKRPQGARLWGQHMLLPLIPNLSLAAVLVYLKSNRLLPYLRLFNPDLAWLVRVSGGFGTVWAVIRTGLILQSQLKDAKHD